MASDFVQIKFFWLELKFLKKLGQFSIFFLIFCMRPHFLPTYKLSFAAWGQKRILP